ncbi:hypothetical protein CERSUDRAFT_115739 [Gelatoporia subvermispora B]|uniref:Ubiquitin 3 binding protein But2 C-terminal domain-containing protein n=1 Tax=Ceriporiopsis subvermispora (strain B) TaxID=914234 RepID=M2RAG9_CERS8|nr:hypothetical protein CERSUDRAFT_115739 [Gelatoporia subvermispora B]
MIALSLLAAAVALPAVLASPAMRLRQVFPPGCGAGAPGDFDTASNVSLTALNTTLPNSNSDGVPLVAVMTDIFGAQSNYELATEASVSLQFTVSDFSLENGALVPIVSNQQSTDLDVISGDILKFSSATGGTLPSRAEIYCGIANTDPAGGGIPEPLLSLQGDTSDFALCEADGVNVVVYQPSDNFGSYDFSTCYSVDILIFEH